MEIRQLATFIRVAQFKSFSRAAESLGYSQSAVTVQIRQLEEELNTRLFDRMGKRIALTDTGERFFSHACDVISQVNQARMSVAATTELHGTLHIGTIESLTCLKLPAVLHRYRQHHPKVSIHITVGEPEELIEQMERGELDMIYVLDEPLYSNNWHKLMEQREEIVFVASASLGEALGGRELTTEELVQYPFFLTEQDNYRRVLNRRLAARRCILTPSLECSDTSFLIRMLEIDRGVSFLPWYAVESSVRQGKLVRLSVADCYISLYRQIFCHKEKWRTREMDEFVRFAEQEDK
ncbi:LysR family transcriptional regulator [Agathobaculum sp.]|uniref:LysR family transcriptional regulator n=1 Tax=Agathobaculum sp. TaxID=2048138 RepID=UPI0026727082|nr:LysR family transcriptional regulator [uncultured Agathobaculum sp.]